MEDHILVCPFQENILSEFSGKRIVVRTEEISSLPGIFRYFDKSSNRLYAIMLNIDEPFANIDFEEAGKDIGYPVHIFAPEMGDFKVLYQKLPLLRSIPIKVFLSSDNDENYTSLKILASLGIQCGIYFREQIDWDLLEDLMIYTAYSKAEHAPVEPFHYVVSQYHPKENVDYSSVYFDNPTQFVHINNEGKIALSNNELIKNNFFEWDINKIDNIDESIAYQDHLNQWHNIFLNNSECASCQAFKICLGKFYDIRDKEETCKVFFKELLEAANISYRSQLKSETI